MSDIYFEVPASTHECKICISHGDDLWQFRIIFFESEFSNIRTVTVIGECREDQSKEVQTLSAGLDNDHDNEFMFEFEATDNTKVTIEIFEDTKSFRSINVTY